MVAREACGGLLCGVLRGGVAVWGGSAGVGMAGAMCGAVLGRPASGVVLWRGFFISDTNGIGLIVPAWPPAPAATKIKPSTPTSTAFSA